MSQLHPLAPIQAEQPGAGCVVAGQLSGGAADPTRWDATVRCGWLSQAEIFFSSYDTTATLDYEMVRAADPMRSMRARGPNGATEWRAGCSAIVATGLNRSSHVEQDAFALHSAAAAAAGLFQRVSHNKCQVNALVVVAPAALAAAVYDAALATPLAASLAAALASAALPA